MIEYLPIGNAINVIVRNFHASLTDIAILDAALTFSIYDEDGVVLSGCSDIAMSATTNPDTLVDNDYVGVTPALVLDEGSDYQIVVEGTNYEVRWERWFAANPRAFGD